MNTFFGDPLKVLKSIQGEIGEFNLFSHEETGTENSWEVDRSVKAWTKECETIWREYPTNAVIRD